MVTLGSQIQESSDLSVPGQRAQGQVTSLLVTTWPPAGGVTFRVPPHGDEASLFLPHQVQLMLTGSQSDINSLEADQSISRPVLSYTVSNKCWG